MADGWRRISMAGGMCLSLLAQNALAGTVNDRLDRNLRRPGFNGGAATSALSARAVGGGGLAGLGVVRLPDRRPPSTRGPIAFSGFPISSRSTSLLSPLGQRGLELQAAVEAPAGIELAVETGWLRARTRQSEGPILVRPRSRDTAYARLTLSSPQGPALTAAFLSTALKGRRQIGDRVAELAGGARRAGRGVAIELSSGNSSSAFGPRFAIGLADLHCRRDDMSFGPTEGTVVDRRAVASVAIAF